MAFWWIIELMNKSFLNLSKASILFLMLATISPVALAGAPRGHNREYVKALKVADCWAVAYKDRDWALAKSLLDPKIIRTFDPMWVIGLSNPSHFAYQIAPGVRLRDGSYQFKVHLDDYYTGYPTVSGQSESQLLTVRKDRSGIWKVASLPSFHRPVEINNKIQVNILVVQALDNMLDVWSKCSPGFGAWDLVKISPTYPTSLKRADWKLRTFELYDITTLSKANTFTIRVRLLGGKTSERSNIIWHVKRSKKGIWFISWSKILVWLRNWNESISIANILPAGNSFRTATAHYSAACNDLVSSISWNGLQWKMGAQRWHHL